jgi:galacturan 1,4-alpha-galacturonidase
MAEAMGNVDKLGDGDEAKKTASVVKVEEIQKVDESTTLQSPVATVSLLQRCGCSPNGSRRGKIIFWSYVVGFAIMLLILILLASIFGVRAHAKSTSGHPKPTSTYASSTSVYGSPTSTQSGITCTVTPAADGKDSAAVIRKAFKSCGRATAGQRNRIVFQNTTYNIASVLETTELKDVDIELHGTLSWDNSNLDYWLNHSLVVGYQNQSTAWRFGGDGITFQGFGTGTFNGNGDVWYRFINGRSNYPRRPHQLTITDTTNSTFEGLNFLQSQMWTMTVIHSSDVLLQDIYVNNTSKTGAPTVNTDGKLYFTIFSNKSILTRNPGCDTIYANNITFRRWRVDNGDDAISPKANSTNILIEDSEFYRGSGIALGSIGQMDGQFETIENVTCRNITSHNTKNGAYIKT